MTRDPRQGMLAVDDESTPPPSLLEDDELQLFDLAGVAYVERGD